MFSLVRPCTSRKKKIENQIENQLLIVHIFYPRKKKKENETFSLSLRNR